jgi:hypothetical protein
MMAKTEMNHDILIEAEKEKTDYYYHLLKKMGWFDFVDDFIEPRHRLEGIRIDTEYNYPHTIKTAQIRCDNTLNILGQLKSLNRIID